MQCTSCGARLPRAAKFCPECGATVATTSGAVDTGGGAFVGGHVSAGGDFVGRDLTVRGNYTRSTQAGLSGGEIAQLFGAVYHRISEPTTARMADDQEVHDTVARVEQEVAKGEQADAERIERWLGTLKDIAPDVLEVAVNVLISPAAAVTSAVRAVAKRFQVRQA
jgi:hypothetical protein